MEGSKREELTLPIASLGCDQSISFPSEVDPVQKDKKRANLHGSVEEHHDSSDEEETSCAACQLPPFAPCLHARVLTAGAEGDSYFCCIPLASNSSYYVAATGRFTLCVGQPHCRHLGCVGKCCDLLMQRLCVVSDLLDLFSSGAAPGRLSSDTIAQRRGICTDQRWVSCLELYQMNGCDCIVIAYVSQYTEIPLRVSFLVQLGSDLTRTMFPQGSPTT